MLLSTTFPIVALVTLMNDGTDDNNATPHPVAVDVNDDGVCLGLIRITDINQKNRKQVILVDHNEASQSVEGLDEAEILEVVDTLKGEMVVIISGATKEDLVGDLLTLSIKEHHKHYLRCNRAKLLFLC